MSLAPPPTARFLIIDDVAPMRILIRGLLFKLEYKNVVEAAAVPEAIALLEKMHGMGTPVDIVLSD
jgi:CheY-like chemotaxis protein